MEAVVPVGVGTATTPPVLREVVRPGNNSSIVYIEDNLANMDLMYVIAKSTGAFEIIAASFGSEGIRLVEEHKPDMVLLDVHLPDMSGLEVIRRLKSQQDTAGIPVVVLSADATTSQIRALKQAGAKAYIVKPVDIPLLLAEVEDCFITKKGRNSDSPRLQL